MTGTRRYKVAYIISSFNTGGKELILLNVLRKTDTTRFEPMLFVAKGGGDLIPGLANYKVYIGVPRGNVLSSLPALWQMLVRERPDVVWCVAPGVTGFAGRLFAYLLKVPVIVISLHGRRLGQIMDWPNRLITRLTTDKVVTTSTEFGSVLLQEGIPKHLLQIIYNGIDTERFQPPADRRIYKQHLLDVATNRPVIGTVGSLRPVKAQHILLKAAPHVLAQHPDALFVIAGEGVSRPKLESLCLRLDIQESVCLLGLRHDIPDILSSFDIFVLTSDDESFGNVIVEAMASGLPIINTAVGGVPELVNDEIGILIPAGDPTALAGAIVRLLDDPARRQVMGEAARQRAVERFSLETMIQARERLLLELMEPHR